MKNTAILFLAAVVLNGCWGDGNNNGGPPPDISGQWGGWGNVKYYTPEQTLVGKVNLQVTLQRRENDQYSARWVARSYDINFKYSTEETWTYDDGRVYFPNGSSIAIRKGRINFDRVVQVSGTTARIEVLIRPAES